VSRILGIDFGERRIGLALSDPTRTIASPLGALVRRAGKRPPWADLLKIIEEQEVTEAVIGLPLALSGEEGPWAAEVREFGAQLQRRTGLPLHWIDERMTSVAAERAVRATGLSRTDRRDKSRVDAAAAALILRHHLDLTRVTQQSEEENG
jgi:putative holliday junction resolvase